MPQSKCFRLTYFDNIYSENQVLTCGKYVPSLVSFGFVYGILSLSIAPVTADLSAIKTALDERLVPGGYALALLNTVQRAQQLYRNYGDGEPLISDGAPVGKRLADGTEIYLFHARFPADQRQRREDAVLKVFGQEGAGLIAIPSVVEAQVCRQYDMELVGRIDEIRERFYAISAERRIVHPAVVAITQAARSSLFPNGSG